MMDYKSGDSWSVQWSVLSAAGAAVNADATPVVTVYRNGVDDTANWSLAAVTNPATGRYRVAGTVNPAAAHGDLVEVEIAATVATVAAKAFVQRFRVDGSGFDRATRCIVSGAVAAGATTTSIPTSGLTPAVTAADQLRGRILLFPDNTTTAALRGQATDVTGSATNGTLTVTALTTAPAAGDVFCVQ
jgi:hypothetical protein